MHIVYWINIILGFFWSNLKLFYDVNSFDLWRGIFGLKEASQGRFCTVIHQPGWPTAADNKHLQRSALINQLSNQNIQINPYFGKAEREMEHRIENHILSAGMTVPDSGSASATPR